MPEQQVGIPDPDTDQTDDRRVAHLIEQLQQRSAALEEANRELRYLSHYRSLFLGRMSHELRTPLTSILGFTEILLDQEQLTEPQKRFCQKIQSSGIQLLATLNQLVDLSRLEVGPAQLFLHEFPVGETLSQVCAAVGRLAQKNQVKVECDQADGVTTIVSDQGRLRQILYTFVAWAISRSGAGQAVNIFADMPTPTVLRVRIEDEGGPVKDINKIFDPEDVSRAGEADLHELGIIVGRRSLQVMKGAVSFETRNSGGLRTTIQLPAGNNA